MSIAAIFAWTFIAAGIVAAVALWLTYLFDEVARARRRVGAAVRSLRAPFEAARRCLSASESALDAAATDFVVAQWATRLAGLPLESLKDLGATNVRWSVLENAGLRNVADLHDVSAQRLAALPGIGDKTATKVVAAARFAADRVMAIPPSLPAAMLTEPKSPPLAAATIDVVAARRRLRPSCDEVGPMVAELNAAWQSFRHRASFHAWAVALVRSRTDFRPAVAAEAAQLSARCQSVGQHPSFIELRASLQDLTRDRAKRWDRAELESRFAQQYADCCAVIEEAFARVSGLKPKTASQYGTATEAIARQVEAFPLTTDPLMVTLRPYQVFGAKYILARKRSILGDEMGLGKTIQALAAAVHCWRANGGGRFLVVAPAGLMINWIREAQRCTKIPTCILHGADRDDDVRQWLDRGGIAVTSYNTLVNLRFPFAAEPRASVGKPPIDLLIADEAHYVKNPEAQRTAAVRALLPFTERACLMSGTPLENRPTEFTELIDMLRPGDGSKLRDANLVADVAVNNADKFHEAIAGVYLRRNQQDVLRELPDKIEIEQWFDLEGDDLEAYRRSVAGGNFMAMRRATTIGNGASRSAKLELLLELLEDHEESGRKVLVFSYFLEVLQAVRRHAKQVVGVIDGSLSSPQRMQLVEDFQRAAGHKVLVAQIEAGGQGLNIQAASAVVLMEPQLKPTIEQQAIARAHRMGQTQRVIVHRLLARESVDERLVEMLSRKTELIDVYARQSAIKNASVQATDDGAAEARLGKQLETHLAGQIVAAEQRRLCRATAS